MPSPGGRSLLLAALAAQLLLLTCHAYLTAFNITVPESYRVTSQDSYVCTVLQLPKQGHKLVGVVPMADQKIVHHILLFGERASAPARRGTRAALMPGPALPRDPGPRPRERRLKGDPRSPAGCAAPHIAPSEDNPTPAWDCMHSATCAQGAEVIM
jgi:hypothetical protein